MMFLPESVFTAAKPIIAEYLARRCRPPFTIFTEAEFLGAVSRDDGGASALADDRGIPPLRDRVRRGLRCVHVRVRARGRRERSPWDAGASQSGARAAACDGRGSRRGTPRTRAGGDPGLGGYLHAQVLPSASQEPSAALQRL